MRGEETEGGVGVLFVKAGGAGHCSYSGYRWMKIRQHKSDISFPWRHVSLSQTPTSALVQSRLNYPVRPLDRQERPSTA